MSVNSFRLEQQRELSSIIIIMLIIIYYYDTQKNLLATTVLFSIDLRFYNIIIAAHYSYKLIVS